MAIRLFCEVNEIK